MTRAIAVITARSGSKRLPWKNMLPINGRTISELSMTHAKAAGLYAVITTDIDDLLKRATELNVLPVMRPQELADGNSHFNAIRHAVSVAVSTEPSLAGAPVVLLQPTSPFRNGAIIKRCLDAHSQNPDKVILSGRTIHYADVSGLPLSAKVWDGCVAVYPHNAIGHSPDSLVVENEHGNMLQIDTEEDYIQACIQAWRLKGCWLPLGKEDLHRSVSELSPMFSGNNVTLVGRADGIQIDQSKPVFWLNHCVGWDGGRADALMVVASKNITNVGINKELAEVAMKAKVVIIRDFGQSEWVLANLKTSGKLIVLKDSKHQVTTGAVASALIGFSGGRAERFGFQRGIGRIAYCYRCFTDACVSDEIALLEVSGKEVGNLSL